MDMRITAFVLMLAGQLVRLLVSSSRRRGKAGYTPIGRYLVRRWDKNAAVVISMAVVAFAAPVEWFEFVGSYQLYEGLALGQLGAFVVGIFFDVLLGKLFARFGNGHNGNGGAAK